MNAREILAMAADILHPLATMCLVWQVWELQKQVDELHRKHR